jgi:hypothetical protein
MSNECKIFLLFEVSICTFLIANFSLFKQDTIIKKKKKKNKKKKKKLKLKTQHFSYSLYPKIDESLPVVHILMKQNKHYNLSKMPLEAKKSEFKFKGTMRN